jgi:hypothetical protein
MITVKDLKAALDEYQEDMPVYWGIDSVPCWDSKKDKTIEEFPMRLDYRVFRDSGGAVPYLYFGDYNDIPRVRKECVDDCRRARKYYSLWRHVWDIITGDW